MAILSTLSMSAVCMWVNLSAQAPWIYVEGGRHLLSETKFIISDNVREVTMKEKSKQKEEMGRTLLNVAKGRTLQQATLLTSAANLLICLPQHHQLEFTSTSHKFSVSQIFRGLWLYHFWWLFLVFLIFMWYYSLKKIF